MTIRRRLFWSNILMIAVPACLTALMGLLCMGMVWLVMQGGSGLGMEHSAEFYHMGEIAAETVASAMETGEENLSGRLEGLTSLLDQGTMSAGARVRFQASHLVFTSDKPIPWTIDGEYGGSQTVNEVVNCPRALNIIGGK